MGQVNTVERSLRSRLGIPADAEQVLIFGETSHWDPNWLHTTEEYFTLRVATTIDRVIEELQKEERRVFAFESLYFVQRYWRERPQQRAVLRELFNGGRLRLTGTGITTPDTVLPATEAILRDYLYGQTWLWEHGITAEPTLAYLPDDFGYSPALPTMLSALGYDKVGITRIDGMYFIACDYRPRSAFPLPGSSAETLQREHETQDFFWQAADGSTVLTHWNAFNYFQGDMLACVGVVRWMGTCYGFSCRSPRHVARRIHRYRKQLAPLAKTPYLYCPIGCDFNDPIPDLVALLDRYNAERYPDTGLWVLCAGMDDYLELVRCHADKLPTLRLDPNPYWMGFYASRQEAKLRCNRIVRKLILAEKLAACAGAPLDPSLATLSFRRQMKDAWQALVLSNHHDFITGTSPDRVWLAEQRPLLRGAEDRVDLALLEVSLPVGVRPARTPPPEWSLEEGTLVVGAKHYQLTLSEAAGGCITSVVRAADGRELLAAPANDLIAYKDSGGLWRMGHEYRGGVFREVQRASARAARIEVRERAGLLEIWVLSELAGKPFVRMLWISDDSPVLRMRLVGTAAHRRTVCCAFPLTLRSDTLTMDVPGGLTERQRHKLYDPTFWPARSFAYLRDADDSAGFAAFLGGPAAVALSAGGTLQWVAFRNAPKERAFAGLLPILAHPAAGTDPDEGVFDYAVWMTPGGDARANRLPFHVRRALRAAMFAPNGPDLDALANSAITSDHPEVLVSAAKDADHGAGVIVRLRSFAGRPVTARVRYVLRPATGAMLCDARERDRAPLPLDDGAACVPIAGEITSVRLLF